MPPRFPESEWSQPGSPLDRLFQSINAPQRNIVGKGSIITFSYTGQTRHRIHDPYPLVIVSDIFTDMIRGVNLHYLTLPYVRNLVGTYANQNFSYRFISGDAYIVGAFRSYKRNGISQLRMMDADFLRNLLTVVRALAPGEIEQMREQIRNLIQEQTQQPPAQPGPEITGPQPPPAEPGTEIS